MKKVRPKANEKVLESKTYIPKLSEPVGQTAFDRFGTRSLIIAAVSIGLYLLWTGFVLGLRTDHLYLIGIITTAWFATEDSRKVLIALIPVAIYWLLYDSMRVYPNYLFNEVHIIQPYELEKSLFGILSNGEVLTPNEYMQLHHNKGLDVLTALFYLCWIPVPIGYMVYLYFRGKELLIPFSMVFLLVNILGIIGYYLYPAAPPWYVEQYGFEFIANTRGYAAGLLNFDEIMGITMFRDMYDKNANVFAAIPSLHSAFPVILTYFGWKKGLKWGTLAFGIITLGIWFSAIYTNHHYIIDVLLGGLCAVLAVLWFEAMMKINICKNWIEKYTSRIM